MSHDPTRLPLTQYDGNVEPSLTTVNPQNTNVRQNRPLTDSISEANNGKSVPRQRAQNEKVMQAVIDLCNDPTSPDGLVYASNIAVLTNYAISTVNLTARRIARSGKPCLGYMLIIKETGQQTPKNHYEIQDANGFPGDIDDDSSQ